MRKAESSSSKAPSQPMGYQDMVRSMFGHAYNIMKASFDPAAAAKQDPKPEVELKHEQFCMKAVDLCKIKHAVGDYFLLQHPMGSPIFQLPSMEMLLAEPGTCQIDLPGLELSFVTNAPWLLDLADCKRSCGKEGVKGVATLIARLLQEVQSDPGKTR